MLSIKWKENTWESNKQGTVLKDGTQVCKIETWGFSSCACFILKSFSSYKIGTICPTEFWNFITSTDHALSWYPNEVYFLLAQDQLPAWKKFYKHKGVKLRDRFTNKAHGPNDLFLFRYSKAGDFKRRTLA